MDNSDKVSASARDGLIGFGGYTTEQLVELESNIDPERFPRNHARLVEELNRRKRTEASNSPPRDRWDIRFSRSESFWSWAQAKRRRQWFYGRGLLEIQPAEIVLTGWQRTWLGMPVQGERRIARESIRNAGRDNATVLINVAGWSRSGRKLEFDCDSPESALSLCGRLPPVRDLVFEREWQEMRAFHGALYAPGNYPWGATALVLINVLVFLVFFINTKGWFGVQPQLLTVWGSSWTAGHRIVEIRPNSRDKSVILGGIYFPVRNEGSIRPPFGPAVEERFRTSSDNKTAVVTGVCQPIQRLVGW